ncbi:MAG: E3 binding domain-containing protein, partial [Actinomycetota bacterium]
MRTAGVAEIAPGSTGSPPTAATPKTGGGEPLGSGAISATPAVRKLAKDLGVDLAAVVGSGPDGRVTREDVERAASGAAAPTGGDAIP